MSVHQKLNYLEIKKSIINKTQEYLMGGDWDSLNTILKSSPNQLIKLCNFSAFEKQVMIAEITLIDTYFVERNNNKYLSDGIHFILSVLALDHQIFSDNFKNYILTKILPNSENLSGNAQELINNALGKFLIENIKNKLIDYPRLFENLISKFPMDLAEFVPKLVELERWHEVYSILVLVPNLVTQYQEELESLIRNGIFSRYHFNEMKKILHQNNFSLHSFLLAEEKRRKSDFLEEFLSLDSKKLTDTWIRIKGSFFSFAINLFSDEELTQIIRKLMSFNINNSNNTESHFISGTLFDISFIGKSYLFEEFLLSFKDLRYTQFISAFIEKNPSKKAMIKNSSISILDIQNREPRINSQYLDFLYGENIIEMFEELINTFPYTPGIISIFFAAKVELNESFTKILENYYDQVNFGKVDNDSSSEYHSILFGIYPNYSKGFFIKKLKEFLSNQTNREWFNPWPSPNFIEYFDQLDDEFQREIVDLLIERRRFNCIIHSFKNAPHKFSKHIDKFLDMNSANESDIRNIMFIFEIIIRNHSSEEKILKKILLKMEAIPNTYDKGQLLSYLGDNLRALDCFSEAINQKTSLSQICFIFTDYLLEYLGVNKSNIMATKCKEIEDELNLIEEDFEFFNINKESGNKFPFKVKFLKARFMLFYGINHLNMDNYNSFFVDLNTSYDIFTRLAQSRNLPEHNKHIIKIYISVSSILLEIIERIKNLKKINDIELLNQELSNQIKQIRSGITYIDFKTERILNSLENFTFNENGKLTYLQFELPAIFCPLPPPIESIYIKLNDSEKDIFPWDHKLHLQINAEPLKVIPSTYQQVILFQEFAKKDGIFYYDIEINGPEFIKIIHDKPEYKNGINIFKFDIVSDKFIKKRDLNIILRPNDICLVGIDLLLPIEYESLQFQYSNDHVKEDIIEILIKCVYQFQQKFKSIKESEDHYSIILSGLINNLVEHRNWHTEDQKPSGKSASYEEKKSKNVGGLGELDFVIMDENNKFITICEALVLRYNDETRITEHLSKIFDYDATGRPFNFVLIYSKAVNYEDQWVKYQNSVLKVPFKHELEPKDFKDLSDHYKTDTNLRMGRTIHLRQGKSIELYHFFINISL